MLKLGLKPARRDPRTLRLAKYLTPALPPIPDSADWSAKVPGWLMYANDKYGDCAMATVAESIRTWTSNDEPFVCRTPSEEQVVSEYLAMSPDDQGLVYLDVLTKWRKTGLLGHHIGGFAEVDSTDHHLACAGVHLFGTLLLGMQLPLAVQGASEWLAPSRHHRRGIWTPSSWGGHAVPAVKYDATGLWVVTWQKLLRMDWSFYDLYCSERYVVISPDWLGKDFTAPNGVDLASLSRDIQAFN